ncbi:hypothetical protein LPU83_pLPU83b_0561 (plasmid) [Rhizobium favelukesii]|uniref:Uncharacterized protein n=1 Tax=Rhizobium favelukesii TaxID=348824 RepID=W6S295_9HYPH|nr:hypothetical protein LPU83_pLPU83b_0561 [Rhizobium favelukesii]
MLRRARRIDLEPIREFPYGPDERSREKAGQMSATDYAHNPPKTILAFIGASTDGARFRTEGRGQPVQRTKEI